MELNGVYEVFLGGMLGTVLVELVKVAAWRDKDIFKEKHFNWTYVFAVSALLLVSGFVAVINGIHHVSLVTAIQLGISAPAIVSGYATASNARQQKKVADAPHAELVGLPKDQKVAKTSLTQRMTALLAW